MKRPLLVAESIVDRHALTRVAGVEWSATHYVWLSPVFWIGLGWTMALADRAQSDLAGDGLAAVGYGAMLYASNVVHSLGHVVAGWVADAPVESVLLTSTRDVIIYRQPGGTAPRGRRLRRALGGPLANLVTGGALLWAGVAAGFPTVRMAGIVSLAVGVWSLAPVPSLDGWVIWRALLRRKA